MGVTRFPNGVEVGDSTTAATLSIGGTTVSATAAELNRASTIGAVAGPSLAHPTAGRQLFSGTAIVTGSTAIKPSGITTALFVTASPYGALPAGSGTAGGFIAASAAVGAGGTITLYAWDNSGTASTQAGTISYVVIGT